MELLSENLHIVEIGKNRKKRRKVASDLKVNKLYRQILPLVCFVNKSLKVKYEMNIFLTTTKRKNCISY